MADETDDRRRFQRVATDKAITIDADGTRHIGIVLDISLRGLLFELAGDWRPLPGAMLKLRIQLDGETRAIHMDGEVAHVDDHHVGLRASGMDLESASLLRRMVELNLGDEQLLERDLSQLLSA